MIDFIILIFFIIGIFSGWNRGFVNSLIRIVGFFLSFYLAYHYYKQTASVLKNIIPLHINDPTNGNAEQFVYQIIAFAILFIGTRIVISVLGSLINSIFKLPVLRQINSFAGGVLGFVEVYLVLLLALFIALIVPVDQLSHYVHQSKIAYFMVQNTPIVSTKLIQLWNGVITNNIL
jgi:uncharacterized membrane protein required for colicin V production